MVEARGTPRIFWGSGRLRSGVRGDQGLTNTGSVGRNDGKNAEQRIGKRKPGRIMLTRYTVG